VSLCAQIVIIIIGTSTQYGGANVADGVCMCMWQCVRVGHRQMHKNSLYHCQYLSSLTDVVWWNQFAPQSALS